MDVQTDILCEKIGTKTILENKGWKSQCHKSLTFWLLLMNTFISVVMVTVRTPTFVESPEMKYFVDDSLPELLKEDKDTLWIVEFYTSFSPHCNAVKPIFGALSRE